MTTATREQRATHEATNLAESWQAHQTTCPTNIARIRASFPDFTEALDRLATDPTNRVTVAFVAGYWAAYALRRASKIDGQRDLNVFGLPTFEDDLLRATITHLDAKASY